MKRFLLTILVCVMPSLLLASEGILESGQKVENGIATAPKEQPSSFGVFC